MAQRCSHQVYNDARKHVLTRAQQRAQGTCQLATIAHCAMSCQGQQEQCVSHPALSNKARSGIRCRTCVLLCAGRSACVSSAQAMCQPTLPLHGDGLGSFSLTMVPVLTWLLATCAPQPLLATKTIFEKIKRGSANLILNTALKIDVNKGK